MVTRRQRRRNVLSAYLRIEREEAERAAAAAGSSREPSCEHVIPADDEPAPARGVPCDQGRSPLRDHERDEGAAEAPSDGAEDTQTNRATAPR